ncbi:putative phage repressor [Pseudomonas sp. M47T1]|nr:putative phage repressor [Pseudomonas sp. M47T1]
MAGPPKTTQAALARACGIKPPSVNDWLSGKTKTIEGENLLNAAEALKVIPMWLATGKGPMRKDADVIDVEGLPSALAQKIKSYRPLVAVERFDIAGSMGPGTEPPEMNMVVEQMSLDAAWVRQNLVYTSTDNLKLISGKGDSMAPTIRNGDALLVDSGITTVESDAIYFFQMGGRLHVKRIQRNLDGLTIISDNDQYREIDVPAGREGDIQILAQIIYWWTGRSF